MKWRRVKHGHYHAVDDNGNDWELYRGYGGSWDIWLNGKYWGSEEGLGALNAAKQRVAQLQTD